MHDRRLLKDVRLSLKVREILQDSFSFDVMSLELFILIMFQSDINTVIFINSKKIKETNML